MLKLEELLTAAGAVVEWTDKGRISQLADTREHQGVALQVSPYPYADLETLLGQPRLLMLDNIEDPQNAGAIIRSAEVFGFNAILIPLKGVPGVYPSVVKASAGATEHALICRDRNANAYVKRAIEAGYTVVALDGKGADILGDPALRQTEKMLLVAGGEDKSVGRHILDLAHHIAAIPQAGRINSLNASVAAGVAMHALRRPATPRTVNPQTA
jgi:23S rRNA (guanosine2251-2'-O)-methyltransferase